MRLSDLFIPLMAFTTDFEAHPRGSVEELSNTVNELITKIRTEGHQAGLDIGRLDAALFPVVAWMDERFLSLRVWDSQRRWQRCLLQRFYFNTSLAGVEFFERLQNLAADDNQLREIYLLILSMGFLGQFAKEKAHSELMQSAVIHNRGWHESPDIANSKLSQIRREQFRIYLAQVGYSADDQERLFPFAYQKGNQIPSLVVPKWRAQLSRPRHLMIAILPPVIVLLLALYLNGSLNKTINTFLESIGV